MIKTVLAQFEEHDRRIFWGFVALLVMSLAVYVYFLSMSVYAVVERKGAESHSNKINSHLSQLETEYVALDKQIDLALAHERGFADISVPKYLSTKSPEKTLSIRTGYNRE